jgi:hypothetical protein
MFRVKTISSGYMDIFLRYFSTSNSQEKLCKKPISL